jgi:hypothetical protein
MRYYLRVINPAVALSVFVLCTWASIGSDNGGVGGGTINIFGIIIGGLSTYFFAKGVFCSLSLFISGKILLEIMQKKYPEKENKLTKPEIISFAIFAFAIIGILAGLYLIKDHKSTESHTKVIENPNQIQIVESNRIPSSEYLRITGKIKNNSSFLWQKITIKGNIFIGGKFADDEERSIDSLKPNDERYFIIEYTKFQNRDIKDSLKYELNLSGIK